MGRNKRFLMAFCFCLGLIIFVSTAFADITNKSGYDQLKDSIKYTFKSMDKHLSSYTITTSTSIKDNGKLIMSSEEVKKQSRTANEEHNTYLYGNTQKQSYYYYNDKEISVSYDSSNDTYYIYENSGDYAKVEIDPFEDSLTNELEKLFDLFIGNLKDCIIYEKREDGSKKFSGFVDEGQIPAIINAVTSFEFRKEISSRTYEKSDVKYPNLKDDVYIKKLRGTATTNKNGLIEDVAAACTITGKDFDGINHDLSAEITIKVNNINSTRVVKPDLAGKKVEKTNNKENQVSNITEKFEGMYKNDIVIQNDGKYEKIGERIVELARLDDTNFKGSYTEEYVSGYEDYFISKETFDFDATLIDSSASAKYTYIDSTGSEKTGYINFDTVNGKIFFSNNGSRYKDLSFDNNFSRVFE
ncbi:MAG TPA: hypothetical protein VIO64_11085 [Pseudobacteroides sp.]|uniref:hypothetical protein n=1 Tax=Pseudobacteroides sp. TaxID=1968840 RepID=UPI002F9265F0